MLSFGSLRGANCCPLLDSTLMKKLSGSERLVIPATQQNSTPVIILSLQSQSMCVFRARCDTHCSEEAFRKAGGEKKSDEGTDEEESLESSVL